MISLREEWLTCPRCKKQSMYASQMGRNVDNTRSVWWLCKNHRNCGFPLDLPPNIFQIQQTPEQYDVGFVPPPMICQLSKEYHHHYPLTFQLDTDSSRAGQNSLLISSIASAQDSGNVEKNGKPIPRVNRRMITKPAKCDKKTAARINSQRLAANITKDDETLEKSNGDIDERWKKQLADRRQELQRTAQQRARESATKRIEKFMKSPSVLLCSPKSQKSTNVSSVDQPVPFASSPMSRASSTIMDVITTSSHFPIHLQTDETMNMSNWKVVNIDSNKMTIDEYMTPTFSCDFPTNATSKEPFSFPIHKNLNNSMDMSNWRVVREDKKDVMDLVMASPLPTNSPSQHASPLDSPQASTNNVHDLINNPNCMDFEECMTNWNTEYDVENGRMIGDGGVSTETGKELDEFECLNVPLSEF